MEDQDDHKKVIFRVLYLFIHHKNFIVLMCENVLLLKALKHCEVYFMHLIFICCSSKNSRKSLFSWFSVFWQFLWRHILWGREFADLTQSMLMSLSACVCLICFVILHTLDLPPLTLGVFVKSPVLQQGAGSSKGVFLTGNGHIMIIWTFTYLSFGFNKLKTGCHCL